MYAHHESFDDIPTPKTVADLHPVLIRRAHVLHSDDASKLLARWKRNAIHDSDGHRCLHRG